MLKIKFCIQLSFTQNYPFFIPRDVARCYEYDDYYGRYAKFLFGFKFSHCLAENGARPSKIEPKMDSNLSEKTSRNLENGPRNRC